jgi:hypothetical protein
VGAGAALKPAGNPGPESSFGGDFAMVTPKQNETIAIYRALMSEARYRIDAFNHILAGGTGLAEALVIELCFLQLRMLCETIALASVVIHGDISEIVMNRKLATEWHAEKIIDALEKLHSNFFPQPVEYRDKHIQGGVTPNAITKEEVIKLYGICGDALHRGTAKKISNYKTTKSRKFDAPEITIWVQKIEDLLGTHVIVSFAGTMIVMCVLRDMAHNMGTTTTVLEHQAVPPPGQMKNAPNVKA